MSGIIIPEKVYKDVPVPKCVCVNVCEKECVSEESA